MPCLTLLWPTTLRFLHCGVILSETRKCMSDPYRTQLGWCGQGGASSQPHAERPASTPVEAARRRLRRWLGSLLAINCRACSNVEFDFQLVFYLYSSASNTNRSD